MQPVLTHHNSVSRFTWGNPCISVKIKVKNIVLTERYRHQFPSVNFHSSINLLLTLDNSKMSDPNYEKVAWSFNLHMHIADFWLVPLLSTQGHPWWNTPHLEIVKKVLLRISCLTHGREEVNNHTFRSNEIIFCEIKKGTKTKCFVRVIIRK